MTKLKPAANPTKSRTAFTLWRPLLACLIIAGILGAGYGLWTPGQTVTDGRHDRGKNGMWLQHGWLGDNNWFKRYKKNPHHFRDPTKIQQLRKRLRRHHITDIYPHLCPARRTGEIAAVDPAQAKQFILMMDEFRIMPWVGGILGDHVKLASHQWQNKFVESVRDLLHTYPGLSGIHINIEPLPSGNTAFISLLRKLRRRMPSGKIISIAAYPPPTIYQRTSDVHWDEDYYRDISREAHQMVVMMYDTSLRFQKLYQHLMKRWTREVLAWSEKTDVLLGIPVYADHGVTYHHPRVENIRNSLAGIHAGLSQYKNLPGNYQGIAIYSEWEMDSDEWRYLKRHFLFK
jgi:hypothetical protein